MNQYERIVSYIYQYQKNEKGANVGYVRLEKRGNTCRLFVQMRSAPIRSMPKVYLYQQLEQGISKVYAGQMMARGGSMLFKANSSAEKIFGSEQGIEEMEGVFIDTEEETYFASSWKNDSLYLGGRAEHTGTGEETDQAGSLKGSADEKEAEGKMEALEKPAAEDTLEERKAEMITADANVEERDAQKQISEELPLQETLPREGRGSDATEDNAAAKTGTVVIESSEEKSNSMEKSVPEEKDIQMQSICGVCPFKRKAYDYGKKILMTFPSMKPFQTGVARACVRMELQDIGCLPIASWSLSGNRFLLHGYYCYRHLLFAQMEDGRYVLGVPGIYSDREQKNACRFGFSDFQSIGDFGMQQGAFGYWLLELPEENQRFSVK